MCGRSWQKKKIQFALLDKFVLLYQIGKSEASLSSFCIFLLRFLHKSEDTSQYLRFLSSTNVSLRETLLRGNCSTAEQTTVFLMKSFLHRENVIHAGTVLITGLAVTLRLDPKCEMKMRCHICYLTNMASLLTNFLKKKSNFYLQTVARRDRKTMEETDMKER